MHPALVAPALVVLGLSVSSLVTAATVAHANDTVRIAGTDRVVAQLPAPTAGKHVDRVPGMTTGSISTKDPFDARGVVVPNAEVTLGAGVVAPIAALPLKPGTAFAKGTTLVSFDCARQRADLRAARAGFTKADTFYRGKARLLKRGAAGRQEVREARADADAARANVDGLTAVLSMCTVRAPFSGRVLERHADPYEIPAANAPLLTVVDDSKLELDLIVPSRWLRWVKVGTAFRFSVDELGRTLQARVTRVGAKVDAVSQTVKLTGTFRLRPADVLAGMSGTAQFQPPMR